MITLHIASLFGFAACFLSVMSLAAAGVLYRSIGDWRARCLCLEADVAALRRAIETAASISARTGRQVKRIEHDYCDVAERVDVVESRAPDRLVRSFGLSRGEAELAARLHHVRKAG